MRIDHAQIAQTALAPDTASDASRVEPARRHHRAHRHGPPDHAHAHGYRRVELSPRGKRFAAFASLDKGERQELRAFRQELRSAVRSGEADVAALAEKAPPALQRLADELDTDLETLIGRRVAALTERFGPRTTTDTSEGDSALAGAEEASSASPEDVAAAPIPEISTPAASPTISASPDLTSEVAAFAARLREVFSSFQGAVDDLLLDLESFLDAADSESAETASATATIGDDDDDRAEAKADGLA